MNYIKKLLVIGLALMLMVIPTVALADGQIDPKIIEEVKKINEEKVHLKEFANPLTIYLVTEKNGNQRVDDKLKEGIRNSKDRTAIGVRDFVNLIDGLEVFWNEEHRIVSIKAQNGKVVVLPIDKSVVFVDGVMSKIDVPATIDPTIGRTFLPMRTLASSLGYDVVYQAEAHSAVLVEPGYKYEKENGEKVPTIQEIIDPVNEKFIEENKKNIVDSVVGNKTPQLKTSSRTVNTSVGSATKNYVDDIERELMNLVNDYRKQNGVAAMSIDTNLKSLTDIRVAELSSNINSGHQRPDGSQWSTVGDVNGENLAAISLRENNAQTIFDGWKASSGHNQNMLQSAFNSFYISVILDGDMIYAVNLFKQ